MDIRVMTIQDYDAVYALWMRSKNMGFNNLDDSREGVDRLLRRNPNTSFVAMDGDDLVGVILSGQDGRRGYIYHMCVAEAYRRQGIGKALVEYAISHAAEMGYSEMSIGVDMDNYGALRLYTAAGFREILFLGEDADGRYFKLLKRLSP